MENIESSREPEVDILFEDIGELVKDTRKKRTIKNHIHNTRFEKGKTLAEQTSKKERGLMFKRQEIF